MDENRKEQERKDQEIEAVRSEHEKNVNIVTHVRDLLKENKVPEAIEFLKNGCHYITHTPYWEA